MLLIGRYAASVVLPLHQHRECRGVVQETKSPAQNHKDCTKPHKPQTPKLTNPQLQPLEDIFTLLCPQKSHSILWNLSPPP